MNTTENNRLLAQFLGFELTDRVVLPEIYKGEESPFSILEFVDMVRESDNLPPSSIQNLKFHSDWNWLMQVVEKIESLNNHGFTIYRKTTNINGLPIELANTRKTTKIEAVFNACVDFIKWYNEQK